MDCQNHILPPELTSLDLLIVSIILVGLSIWFINIKSREKWGLVVALALEIAFVQLWTVPHQEHRFLPGQTFQIVYSQLPASIEVCADDIDSSKPDVAIVNRIFTSQVWVYGNVTLQADPIICSTLNGVENTPQVVAVRCPGSQMRIVRLISPLLDATIGSVGVISNYEKPILRP